MYKRGVCNYTNTQIQSTVPEADAHRLIQMLMEGALERLSKSKVYLQHGKMAEKGEQLGIAINIIGGLRESLDPKTGGELAANLDNLYDYMLKRLSLANLENKIEYIDEVTGLLKDIKEAWDGIAEQAKNILDEKRQQE